MQTRRVTLTWNLWTSGISPEVVTGVTVEDESPRPSAGTGQHGRATGRWFSEHRGLSCILYRLGVAARGRQDHQCKQRSTIENPASNTVGPGTISCSRVHPFRFAARGNPRL